jgi:MFS family permease
MSVLEETRRPWYHGVTRYQWLVLVIASLGWVFDVFEGQIFVATKDEAMSSLLPPAAGRLDEESHRKEVFDYNRLALASFMVGGALGGILFGRMSDRIGRTRTMIVTIATYSVFTFVSSLSQTWWHLVACRFLVALGVAGEWAVASALVAEVFPRRARARSLAIFHASSVLGTLLAVAAGFFITTDRYLPLPGGGVLRGWRLAFVLGGIPALLIIWVRWSLREPERWQREERASRTGRALAGDGFLDLFGPQLLRKSLIGLGLAAIGMATFWGVHIYGKDLLRQDEENLCLAEVLAQHADPGLPPLLRQLLGEVREESAGSPTNGVPLLRERLSKRKGGTTLLLSPYARRIKRWEMTGMLLVTLGGGLGLVSFGPLSEWLGRRGAFLVFQVGGLVVSLVLFRAGFGRPILLYALPVFGFLTLGMHAGFAVYFPELFPTRLRGTGTGFCFNVGKLVAAPLLFLSGLQATWQTSAPVVSLLFLLGPLLLLKAPETRGCELD